MSLNRQRWRQKTFAFSALLLASGCFGQSGMPGPASSSLQARPPGGFGPVGPGGPTPPRPPVGLPGTVTLAGYNQLADYQAADLAQKLEELQDENRSLLARLQGVQGLLEARERAVLLSRGEVQSATQEVAHARQEVMRCRQEIASLREHIRTADKENQTNMQSVVKMLETKLEHSNPQADAPVKQNELAAKAQKSVIRAQKPVIIDQKPEIKILNN
jgi:predicted nuclease with TOPRIM domain